MKGNTGRGRRRMNDEMIWHDTGQEALVGTGSITVEGLNRDGRGPLLSGWVELVEAQRDDARRKVAVSGRERCLVAGAEMVFPWC